MVKQTWDNYYREYYYKNRDYILRRAKEAHRKASRRYYNEHREEILEKRRIRRIAKQLQEEQNRKAGITVECQPKVGSTGQ